MGENRFYFNTTRKKNTGFRELLQWMDVVCTITYMYLHLKDGVLTFSSGIMHEFKVLLKFLCHDKDDDMLTWVTLLQNFTQWSGIISEGLFLYFHDSCFFSFSKVSFSEKSKKYSVTLLWQKFLCEPFLQKYYFLFLENLTSKQMVQVSLFSYQISIRRNIIWNFQTFNW